MADEESEVQEKNEVHEKKLLYLTAVLAVLAIVLMGILLFMQGMAVGGNLHFNFTAETNGNTIYLHHTGGDPVGERDLLFRINGESISANMISFPDGGSWPWAIGKTLIIRFNGAPGLLEILTRNETKVISAVMIQEPATTALSPDMNPSSSSDQSSSSLDGTGSIDITITPPASSNNSATFAWKPIWSTHTGDEVWDLSVARDGHTILATTSSSLYLLDGLGNSLARYSGNSGALSGDGSSFAVVTAGDVQLRTRERMPLWTSQVPNISASALSADGSKIAVSTRAGELLIFDKAGRVTGSNRTFDWADRIIPLSGIAISDDGGSIFTICQGGIIAYNDQALGIWKVSAFEPRGFSVSRSGSIVAYGSGMPLICLNPQGFIAWSHTMGNDVSGVSITPDGAFIAAASEDQHLHLFGEGGEVIFDYTSPQSIKSVVIAPDGGIVAAGLMDRSLILLDRTGKVVGWCPTNGIINAMRITDDGSLLVTGTNFGDVVAYPIPHR